MDPSTTLSPRPTRSLWAKATDQSRRSQRGWLSTQTAPREVYTKKIPALKIRVTKNSVPAVISSRKVWTKIKSQCQPILSVHTTSPRTSHLLGLLQVNSNPPKKRSPLKVLAHSPQQELRPGSMRRLTRTCTAQKVSRKVTTDSKIWTQVMFRTIRTPSTLRSAQSALCERIRSTTILTTSKSTKK